MSSHRNWLIAALLVLLAGALAATLAQAQTAPPPAGAQPDDALRRAEQALREQGYAPSRLLALGRAQLAQGRLGPAIVSFERGLLLTPRDPALQDALSQARTRAGLSPDAQAASLSRFVDRVSVREWTFAASAACAALALTLLGLTLAARRKRVWLLGVLTSAVALVLAGSATYVARQKLTTAYVLQDDSVLRQSPFSNAAVRGELRPGEAVEQHDAHGDFVYVESERGLGGWVREQELAQLAPAAPGPT